MDLLKLSMRMEIGLSECIAMELRKVKGKYSMATGHILKADLAMIDLTDTGP